NRQEIDLERIDVDKDLSNRLCRIGVNDCTDCVCPLRDLTDRLNRADLVVGVDQRDERHVGAERWLDIVRVHESAATRRDTRDSPPRALERIARLARRRVLDGGGDYPSSLRPGCRYPSNGKVAALRRTRREDDLRRRRSNQARDLGPRGLNSVARASPLRVVTRWVSKIVAKVREHDLEHLR